eukprot:TRINITY_DN21544_c0_g1_i1.p1 TRINITY_DN21544_c0_g1~~TRINITY_DN21544_c0_g1_i1.p1  ORF type:complete len:499 (+),score=62.65 TRINITY_DN21544_c0_g1_i1:55-1551(+)
MEPEEGKNVVIQNNDEDNDETVPLIPAEELERLKHAGGFIRKRYLMSILLLAGLGNVYAMRVNLSAAVEPMQKHYGWSNITQGYVLSAFFWGYILFQVPGAILSEKYGGKLVFGVGVLGTSLLTLILPLCASRLWLLFTVRAVMGLFESVTFPALNYLFTQWVPCTERSFHVAFTAAGAYLGTAIAFPISGILIDLHKDDDDVSTTWPLVFYVFGGCGVLWWIIWMLLANSTPDDDKTITEEEYKYIKHTVTQDADVNIDKITVTKSDKPPWKGFLTSSVAWSIYCCHFSSNFCIYTLMTYLPKYLDEELDFSLKNAGGIAIIPYVAQFAASISSGVFADRLSERTSVRTARIVTETIAFVTAGSCLVIAGWMTETAVAVIFMSLAVGASGFVGGGHCSSYVDVSPHYAGHLFSVGNVVANVAGILAPIVTGYILGDRLHDPTPTVTVTPLIEDSSSDSGYVPASHWRNVFYLTAGVYLFSLTIYVIFMKGKPVQELN